MNLKWIFLFIKVLTVLVRNYVSRTEDTNGTKTLTFFIGIAFYFVRSILSNLISYSPSLIHIV